jgi:glycosyltransferase involved in cell wall biosynthesis
MERQILLEINNWELVYNPINLKEIPDFSYPNLEIPSIAVVARLEIDYKGQDILIQTLSLKKWRDRKFRVNLFGLGPDEDYLTQLVTFYNLNEKVYLNGHVSDIKNVWENHHILVLPSHSEGTPLSLIEALISGRPSLVTDTGDCARMVEDNITGWIAYNCSVKALDEALERAWQQMSNWNVMGKYAYETTSKLDIKNPGETLFYKIVNAL